MVDRVATRLPHRTGTPGRALEDDDVLHTTRAMLVGLSNVALSNIANALVDLLEDLARPDDTDAGDPHLPSSLGKNLVNRLFDAIMELLEPIPDDYMLPPQTLLGQVLESNACVPWVGVVHSQREMGDSDKSSHLFEHAGGLGAYVKTIVEYITATNWSSSFAYVKNVIYSIRTAPSLADLALVVARALPFFWVDGPKLGLIIQELCSSYLHFRKSCQNAVAAALPLLITRWVDRYPDQFVRLHSLHKKPDGGADTLFDMTQAGTDNGKRKTVLYPLQLTLLLMLPDIFEVASNMSEARSNSMMKKVNFLDGLKKALRNGNERAGYCLIALLRAARHFDSNSESALVSYAMDVQDEVKDVIFGHTVPPSPDAPVFDQDMITGAFDNCAAAVLSQGDSREGSWGLVCAILRFLHLFPEPLSDELSRASFDRGFLRPFIFCVLSSDTSIRGLATKLATRLLDEKQGFRESDVENCSFPRDLGKDIWKQSSTVVTDLCERIEVQRQTAEIKSLQGFLAARLTLLRAIPGLSNLAWDAPDVANDSSKLESVLLVSLCTADVDICQTVTSSIGLLLEEASFIRAHNEHNGSIPSVLRNQGTYQELASPAFRFTGLVAFQKRMRGLLRSMHYPTLGILNAWNVAFERWIELAKDISTSSVDAIDDKMLSEWRNLSGFLASLGGICIADRGTALEELPPSGLRWIDRHISEHFEEPDLTRFLRVSIQLLGCSIARVREAMRDVLSTETSSVLYGPLFKALESELEVLLTGVLRPAESGQDCGIIFAEQAASLLRTMVERIETPTDLGGSSFIHLGIITLNFTKFIDSASDGANTLRVKIRVCNLCEAVTQRREHMNLRDDVRTRNRLLECIFGWIARPLPSIQEQQSTTGTRQDDSRRMQKDLDKACLKALAQLTFRLPLQPADSQTDAGMSAQKAQMFHNYFNRFLFLLHNEPRDAGRSEYSGVVARGGAAPDSDLVITILSNLLSANIDVGLKHSLNIGYHENIEIRTAFVKVLYNILMQGTEFGSLTDSAVSEKYEELLDVLTTDLSLPVAMSSVCPTSEVDELTVCLLTIFEQRGLIFELFEALIRHEIGQTENEAEILRRTCVVTKMLSIYAKWKGNLYLRATLRKVLERLMLTSQDLDLELDPARVGSQEELQKNAVQLQIVAKVFMDDICASSMSVPASFRKICSIISDAVSSRFPNAKYTAVGAFVFLRFICPAIVAPESEGLVSSAPTKGMRRGLLLIAKIIQNLANNVLFGAKEPYMFPLNPFLVQNIHLVTGFLREISVPPNHLESRVNSKLLDFGSCVALHRFLYDHWDHVRQTLACREKKEYVVRSPAEYARGTPSISEPLLDLVTKLGPPPLAISWNRPQISSNSPPLYSRFQNFMLRNAFKSSESFLTSRAVYDGGESKDGLSIVCVILRHIENESIDYDTLLYCYLKIASRLWHEPFGLFIDSTCYKGRNEPPDEFFTNLDLLTPSELSLSLSRIYVYNMNSAFKRCFRRLLRVSTRNESSVFHPKNVDYHLIGSLQDLQAHFHLSQLHLPKETISVVTDTRYVFQPVTRLSKSKGMVEVIIKVGSQFVQVTTAKKQEILPGLRLSSIVNDIFRLGEVEEATTTIHAEDESAFGLKADGGKIVMCFTSMKRVDVLQSIRGAKSKHGTDDRAHKPLERLVRPQDVPGTILNLALTNLASPDHTLRLASYNLLGALCRAFEFGAEARIVCAKDLSVPLDPSRFIVNMSKELALTEAQLTSDFLTEFFVSWEGLPEEQKPLGLEYMAPWLSGLRLNVLASDVDGDKSREKVASLFRKFIDLVALDPSLLHALEHHVWPSVARDELLLEIFLDELIKTSLSYDARAESVATVSSVMVGIGTVSLRGKLISRLRKALNRSSLRPTRFLPDNAVWVEICVLLQFCLALSFDSGVQSQMFLPEVFHIVTMLANTGGQDIRLLVHKFLVNTIHAACSSFMLDDAKLFKLQTNLDSLCDVRGDTLSSALAREDGSVSMMQDSGSALATTENLAAILFETCSAAAPSTDVANAWRSRWMSLVASTAFQNNPAIQPKAFAVMGYLAREEVDDDLLYQVLVALRSSVGQFGEDGNSEMLKAIVTSLAKMMTKLPSASRYGVQLFWLAISLVRLVPSGLFNCTAQFLEAILTNIGTAGNVRGEKMVPLLLQSRSQLEEAALPLDEAYGIQFGHETFHFASHSVHGSPYLALILARCVGHEDFIESLWWSDMKLDGTSSIINSRGGHDVDSFQDQELLLMSAVELVDFHHLEDAAQARSLDWLNKLAIARPSAFVKLCGPMPSILSGVLLHGQDSAALGAAHSLLRILTSDDRYAAATGSMQTLRDVLDELGFTGLSDGDMSDEDVSSG
ncbi:GTPase-activator protein for ras-like GTPase domain-containing protein [Hirsutella rhossiliensis]|uniref:GTPase-activator protein for ras-like GTPase domain-containing protein n=1 Tax=Hirsutella rhossiliensis TaxID=111463 RepID=A0A9P8N7D4_9HYPO|nr:GTPase-activator protein for ras-like GTPase domain-containing protein [Hirsutella rhossiliensis]KAH0968342.1 GTPase-activator protein for ras-like GTPase domain-containing protein [Hirsutella rhossiliensis]